MPAKFILQPNLDSTKYKLTDSFSSIGSWRAYTYSANSGGNVGKMDKVGYVMISLINNSIIPIARGDEHNQGWDVLEKLAKKYSFNARNYIPVWAYGNNYIYDEKDIKSLLIAFTKYLSYGGIDGPLNELPFSLANSF